MKAMGCLVVVGVLTLAAGCGHAIKVASDYDRRANLPNYNTYFFLKGNSTGDASIDADLTADVSKALLDKGWIEVPEGEGQAAVIIHTATDRERTNATFFSGWGGWKWSWDTASGSKTLSDSYPVGTVVVTVFDADSRHALWRGFAVDAVSADRKEPHQAREAAVTKLFEQFPTAPDVSMSPLGPAATAPAAADAATILYSSSPAVLVRIDGEPRYSKIDGTPLERIVNTKAFIVRDGVGSYFLRILDGWMQSNALDNWWDVTLTPPTGAEAAVQAAIASNDRSLDLLNNPKIRAELSGVRLDDGPPAIFISTTPAVLLITDGAPRFAPVAGSSLQYAVNTTAKLYKEPTDQELYLLDAVRWYRAWQPEGPWRSVASEELPADLVTRQ